MERPDEQISSFIVKIWLEPDEQNTNRMIWHGYITHVPSGRRRYVKNLREIVDFIELLLGSMGLRVGPFARLRRMMCRPRAVE